MKNLALKYYNEGYNCSQCVLKADEEYFHIYVPEECFSMCSAVGNGFGIGVFCCALVAGTLVFGLIFNEKTATRLRIRLIYDFSLQYDLVNCSQLKDENGGEGCGLIISSVAELVYNMILEEIENGSPTVCQFSSDVLV
jgi:hypothetical protein